MNAADIGIRPAVLFRVLQIHCMYVKLDDATLKSWRDFAIIAYITKAPVITIIRK